MLISKRDKGMKKITIVLALAMSVLGCTPSYEEGLKLKESGDFKAAMAIFEQQAESGNLKAVLELIEWYKKSEPQKAFLWKQEAAKLGDAESQVDIGWAHDGGNSIPDSSKRPEVAFSWYEKAAAQDSTIAQFYMGYSYERGYGVERDEAKASELYLKAAEQGELNSLYFLGVAYYDGGLDVEANKRTGVNYLCKAHQAGNNQALSKLRTSWINDVLIPDYEKAVAYAEAPQGVKGVYAYSGQKASLLQDARNKRMFIMRAKQSTDDQPIQRLCN